MANASAMIQGFNGMGKLAFWGVCLVQLWACSPQTWALDGVGRNRLSPTASREQQFGAVVYEGEVRQALEPSQSPALFRYERRHRLSGSNWLSTHLTWRASDNSQNLLVLQQATHSPQYLLSEFTQVHAQTGTRGRVLVDSTGAAHFTLWQGEQSQQSTESTGAPMVVGPTLFGYVLTNWSRLLQGESLVVRFAVLDKLRSYRFVLSLDSVEPDATVIRFSPDSFWLRWLLPDMFMAFDAKTRKIVYYEGSVPPLVEANDGSLVALRARVDYPDFSVEYR